MNTLYKTVLAASLLATAGAALLAACGGVTDTGGVGNTQTLNGVVHGGQAPVTGSSVTLFQAVAGNAPTTIASATSDSNGNFHLSFNCSGVAGSTGSFGSAASDGLLYLSSVGGNPGANTGTNNSALTMIAALGSCSSLPTSVNLNEVTTAAAAYALSGFTTVSGTAGSQTVSVQASSTNLTGLTNAFATAAVLADPSTGAIPANAASSYLTASRQKLYSLANSLAACVNTTGGSSAQCTLLFNCAMPGASYDSTSNACTGGTGTAPADTLSAALNVVHNAGTVAISGIYNVATQNAVFSPALSAAPNDWIMALNFVGGGMNGPQDLAIDSKGNVWVANNGNNSLSKFSPGGAAVSTSTGYTGGGLSSPYGLAIDASDNVWVANGGTAGSNLSEFNSSGQPVSASGYNGSGLTRLLRVAIDVGGNVWAVSTVNGSLNKFSSSGQLSNSYTGNGVNGPYGIAIDGSGNVWVSNTGQSRSPYTAYLSEFSASGQTVGSSPYTAGLNQGQRLAIDAGGNVWVANGNGTGNSLNKVDSSGTLLSGSSGYTTGGVNSPRPVAIDGSGNVWVGNYNGASASEFSSSGTALSPSTGFTSGNIFRPSGLAVDASGNVWLVNFSSTLIKLVGADAPTR